MKKVVKSFVLLKKKLRSICLITSSDALSGCVALWVMKVTCFEKGRRMLGIKKR